jgi:hypothetical protein
MTSFDMNCIPLLGKYHSWVDHSTGLRRIRRQEHRSFLLLDVATSLNSTSPLPPPSNTNTHRSVLRLRQAQSRKRIVDLLTLPQRMIVPLWTRTGVALRDRTTPHPTTTYQHQRTQHTRHANHWFDRSQRYLNWLSQP